MLVVKRIGKGDMFSFGVANLMASPLNPVARNGATPGDFSLDLVTFRLTW